MIEWLKAVVPIIVAVLALLHSNGVSNQASSNCEAIDNLKIAMRRIIVASPIDVDNPQRSLNFIEQSINLIDEADCH